MASTYAPPSTVSESVLDENRAETETEEQVYSDTDGERRTETETEEESTKKTNILASFVRFIVDFCCVVLLIYPPVSTLAIFYPGILWNMKRRNAAADCGKPPPRRPLKRGKISDGIYAR